MSEKQEKDEEKIGRLDRIQSFELMTVLKAWNTDGTNRLMGHKSATVLAKILSDELKFQVTGDSLRYYAGLMNVPISIRPFRPFKYASNEPNGDQINTLMMRMQQQNLVMANALDTLFAKLSEESPIELTQLILDLKESTEP